MNETITMSGNLVHDALPDIVYEQSKESIVERIFETWGFAPAQITLLESSYHAVNVDGDDWHYKFMVCDHIVFAVMGKGWSTDFTSIERAEAYDGDY